MVVVRPIRTLLVLPVAAAALLAAAQPASAHDLGNGIATAPQNAMASIEPSLQWTQAWPATPTNHTVTVTVGDVGTQKYQVVCLYAQSKSGADFSVGDISVGNNAGTYFNKGTCSTTVATLAGWAQSW